MTSAAARRADAALGGLASRALPSAGAPAARLGPSTVQRLIPLSRYEMSRKVAEQ